MAKTGAGFNSSQGKKKASNKVLTAYLAEKDVGELDHRRQLLIKQALDNNQKVTSTTNQSQMQSSASASKVNDSRRKSANAGLRSNQRPITTVASSQIEPPTEMYLQPSASTHGLQRMRQSGLTPPPNE